MAAVTQAFTELHQLNNPIFATNISSQVISPPGIGAMARSLNGTTYILSVNPTANSSQGDFLVSGLQAGTSVSVLFENRTIKAAAGRFTDSFAGVSRHVYVIPPAASTTIVTATPPGLAVMVDGINCTAPCSYQWALGSNHTIAVNSTIQQGPTGTRYVFSAWSDGGAASHSIVGSASMSQ